jgi:hypothetical protein
MRILVVLLLVIVAAAALSLLYGSYRWRAGTLALRARLDAARVPFTTAAVDFRELDGLPPPAARYLRLVLRNGQPMIAAVRMRHSGSFNMSETDDRWIPFTSDQRVIAQRPGFDWDARLRMFPGLSVRVHDAYVAGEGILHASVLGLFAVSDQRGTRAMAEGELMRFLAEAPWYPTRLLPGQGLQWASVGERSADATLQDGPVSVTLRFAFNDEGLLDTSRSESRGRTVGSEIVPTPWQGRFWDYAERGGMRVPLEGEVAWLPPGGAKPYWRGRIESIEYEPAR